jgi:DNA-binding transcriptional LysR family regulator
VSEAELDVLEVLDAVLTEGSVTGAARQLHLSVPAISRYLKRARVLMGDPLMIRTGSGLVPTPRALALRDRIHVVVAEARTLVREGTTVDLSTLRRKFVIVGNDLLFHPASLESRVRASAPNARCAFLLDCSDRISHRSSQVDLVVGFRDFDHSGEDLQHVKTEVLRTERLVGVARAGHPILKEGVTKERYLAAEHVVSSRRGRFQSVVDHELEAMGLQRNVVTASPSLWSTIWFLIESDLLGAVVGSLAGSIERFGVETFEIPLDIDTSTDVCMTWHQRNDTDPAHRWLRQMVREVVTESVDPYEGGRAVRKMLPWMLEAGSPPTATLQPLSVKVM